MRAILVRGGYNPLDVHLISDVLARNEIGSNSGNILYMTGAIISILDDNTRIDVDEYAGEFGRYTDYDIERINNNYDAFVIPLADAFRSEFAWKLENLADLIRRLTIPCYVFSVGLKAELNPQINIKRDIDSSVKKFMNAVLEKTEIVGVRGENTAKYLEYLGYIPEVDFTVIGCPSMYMLGKEIVTRKLVLNESSMISVNFNSHIPQINEDILRCAKKYKNYYVTGQDIDEIRCLWLGLSKNNLRKYYYFTDKNDEEHANNKFRGFISANDWINYMKSIDLSVGGKLHGNIAAVLGGAVPIFIPADSRTQELVDYHEFPNIRADKWKSISSLEELLDKVDFNKYVKAQKRNYSHYIDFLKKNKIYNGEGFNDRFKYSVGNINYDLSSFSICNQGELNERKVQYSISLQKNHKKTDFLNKL